MHRLGVDTVSRCLLLHVHSVVLDRIRYVDAKSFAASLLRELSGYRNAMEAEAVASREIARRLVVAF